MWLKIDSWCGCCLCCWGQAAWGECRCFPPHRLLNEVVGMPGQLQTTELTELWRIDARLMVKVSKAFRRESHTSHLSVIWVSLGEAFIPNRYSWFNSSKGVCEGRHARLWKQASVECCGLFLHSGLLFILFFLKNGNFSELSPFVCWNSFLFGCLCGTEQTLNSKKSSVPSYLWHKKWRPPENVHIFGGSWVITSQIGCRWM